MENPKIISFTGRSGSGKTTIIEKIIEHFNQKGLTISVIKHSGHSFDIDNRSKDTYRFRESGAATIIITDDSKLALISEIKKKLTPEEIISQYIKQYPDIIIVEGFKDSHLPKIEVIGSSPEPPLFKSGISNIIAIVTDLNIETGLPKFSRDDTPGIIKFIENMT